MSTSLARRQQDAPEILTGALEQIQEHGSLLRFAPDRVDRVALMMKLSEQGLIAWDRAAGRYDLTAAGCDCLKRKPADGR